MSYQIRRSRPNEFRTIEELQRECFGSIIVPAEKAIWWSAVDGNFLVGFAGLKVSEIWDRTVYLCLAGIEPQARGNGLQKRLIRARLKWAIQHGMQWAYTDTRQNPASANSLISCGFKMYEPLHPWSFRDACYWRKRL